MVRKWRARLDVEHKLFKVLEAPRERFELLGVDMSERNDAEAHRR